LIVLFVHDDAKANLEALWKQELQAAGRILALLEQLEGNLNLLDRLTRHDYGAHRSADFHASKWQEHWRNGRDLWRLKLWDLEAKGLRYRVVYAFEPRKQHYHVPGIAPREFNCDASHPISHRILRAYQAL